MAGRLHHRIALVILALFWITPCIAGDEPLRVAKDRPADIVHIKLDLKVDIPGKDARGKATIDLTALRDISSVRFDAVGFDVSKVTFRRGESPPVPVEFINDGESIEVLIPNGPLSAGSEASIVIDYAVTNPSAGLHFFGPSEVEPNVPYVVWSQGESVTNRHWFPCFDHPNEMQTTEMVVTVDAGNEAVSNGRLLSKTKNADGSLTYHWLQDKPHVAYLVTLVVGEFHVEQEMWRGKPIVYYVPREHREDVKRSFGNTIRMLDFFSDITGVEYPWDKYAQVSVEGFGGGMENTSATSLGTSTLHDARAHLDFSSDGLVAHELAHQWFGDLVTCKDWAHLWLNEGFASFMDPVWTEHDLGQDEYDYDIFRSMERAVSGGEDRPVLDRHYEHSRDMFDSRAYPKGASILHMLRRRVGDDMFWHCVKMYLTENAHHPVETADFRKVFERETGRSLERFFHDWVKRAGAPSLDVKFKWSEEDKLAIVTVKQTQEADAFHFPLEVEFHFDGSKPITFRRDVAEKEKRFLFPLPKNPTMVLLDPHDAVLKELKEKKGRNLWEAQLTNAPYATSRIRAAAHFGDSGTDQDIELLAEALQSEKFWGVGDRIAKAQGEAGGDKARDALLAGLTHSHPKVRRAVAGELGSFLHDEQVISALYTLIQKGDASYRVEAAAIRAYGKCQPENATTFLASLLTRDSHREQIRSAALGAMGEQQDISALNILLDWTKPGKPRFCRIAATRSLGKLAETLELSDADLSRIITGVTAHLEGEQRWVKGGAIRMLGKMRADAKAALPVLRAIEANDAQRRVRKAAKSAIKKITSGEPAKLQLDDLRDELEEMRDSNKDLMERLEKIEAKE